MRKDPKGRPPILDPDLYAVFRFSPSGWLREIYFVTHEKEQELILAGKLTKLFRPGPLAWLSRLIRWGR